MIQIYNKKSNLHNLSAHDQRAAFECSDFGSYVGTISNAATKLTGRIVQQYSVVIEYNIFITSEYIKRYVYVAEQLFVYIYSNTQEDCA
jgi:hypothetical protein